jgi:hypothetical protein
LEDVEARLPSLRQVAAELGNKLDQVRVRWLSARVDAGLGRREQARASFKQVVRDFTLRGNAFGAAMASVELAILHLEDGQTVEVRMLAETMLQVFSSETVEREALAAVTLFCEAAKLETLTIDQARSLLADLERSAWKRPETAA